MSRVIRTSIPNTTGLAGGIVRATNGEDISSSVIKIALGSQEAPGTAWFDPDTRDVISPTQVHVTLSIGAAGQINPPPNTYWLWALIMDSTTSEPVPTTDWVKVA